MGVINDDINSVVASAVNARVEAAVFEAMTSDDTIRAYVSAALNEKVEDRYNYRKDTYINTILKDTIKKITKDVVAEEIVVAEDLIRREVKDALDRSIGVITDSLVEGFVASARGSYPSIKVEFADD